MAPLKRNKSKQHRKRGRDRRGTQLLRDYIIPKLDIGEFGEHLSWIGNGKFKIAWMHKSNKKWKPEISDVYLGWAKMKNRLPSSGSFNENEESVQRKGALRIAFNKLQREGQLKHLQDESEKDYRVYQIVDIDAIRADSSSAAGSSSENSDEDVDNPVSSASSDTGGDETSSDVEVHMDSLQEAVNGAVEEYCETEEDFCSSLDDLLGSYLLKEALSSQEINLDFLEDDWDEEKGKNFESASQVQQAGNNMNAGYGLYSPPPAANNEEHSLFDPNELIDLEDLLPLHSTGERPEQGPCSIQFEPSLLDPGLLNNSMAERFMDLPPYLKADPFWGYSPNLQNLNKN